MNHDFIRRRTVRIIGRKDLLHKWNFQNPRIEVNTPILPAFTGNFPGEVGLTNAWIVGSPSYTRAGVSTVVDFGFWR